jgi:hypothetical protein
MTVRVLTHRTDERGWEAEVELPDGRRELAVRSSTPVSEDLDRLIPALLPLAMRMGRPLSLPHPVSTQLLQSAGEVQGILRLWRDELSVVPVEAVAEERLPASGGGVGSFFSGGVDSFFTVLRHADEITHLIFVLGFDIAQELKVLEEAALEMARAVADGLGKELIVVRTNVRRVSAAHLDWDLYHGPALAAVGLSFQSTLRKLFVPSSYNYGNLFPWGSHPLLDPLWSTEALQVVHDSTDTRRVEKVAAIVENDLAMRWLRVCWETPDGQYNCGKCEKCVRTLVTLEAVGAVGRCRTLPGTADRRALARMHIRGRVGNAYRRENLQLLHERDADRGLIRALERAGRPGFRQLIRDPLARATPERVKRALRGLAAKPR